MPRQTLCGIDRTNQGIAQRDALFDEPGYLTIAWTPRQQLERDQRGSGPEDHSSQHERHERQSFGTKNTIDPEGDDDGESGTGSRSRVRASTNEARPSPANTLNRRAQLIV